MTTLDDLRQRLEDRYLEPVTEQTPAVPLAANIDDSQTTLTIEADVLSPDELSLIGAGAIFEIEAELVRIVSFNQSTLTITVRRGQRGTTAAAHTTTSDLRFPTRWTRKTQHEALSDAISALWQPLFVVEEKRATIDTAGYLALPLDTIRIISVNYQRTDYHRSYHFYQTSESRWEPVGSTLFTTHPLDDTVAAVQVDPLPYPSALCVVRYGRRISPPSTVTGEINLLPSGWERIVLVDAAAELLAGVDVDAVTQERMTQQLRLEGFPVKSGSSISGSLIRYREYLVQQARQVLVSDQPKKVRRRPFSWR